jgi:hypothetical protein
VIGKGGATAVSQGYEFAGTDFAAGDVVGLRVWVPHVTYPADADPLVLLKSVYREYYWHDGENVARCIPSTSDGAHNARLIRLASCITDHHHDADNPYRCDTLACHREHRDGIDPGHDCGFYAYTTNAFTDPNPYLKAKALHVMGVVQGYGFRVSKARILGVCLPTILPVTKTEGIETVAAVVDKYLPLAYPRVRVYPCVDDMLMAHPLHGM